MNSAAFPFFMVMPSNYLPCASSVFDFHRNATIYCFRKNRLKELKYPCCFRKIFDFSYTTKIFSVLGGFETLFEDAIAAAEKYNVPLYCGEYGVIELAPKDDTKRWLADIHSVLEKHGIGRAVWNYKGKDFGIIDSDYGF